MTSIADRWTKFYDELENLCDELSRQLPTVVAVSKTRTFEEVQEAIDIGITDFGENYPTNFKEKAEQFPNQNWHFIGTLQRNSAGDVTPYASIMHTLDRKKLTDRLLYFDFDRPCFIQVNISGEVSKSGVSYTKEAVRDLYEYSIKEGLEVTGLMTIGSFDWDDKRNEEEFDKFVQFGHDLGFENFSLGMSGDWRHAVQAGSTHLRIGTEIFGPRDN